MLHSYELNAKARTKATTFLANKRTKSDNVNLRMKVASTRSSQSLYNNELQTSTSSSNQCGAILATRTGAMDHYSLLSGLKELYPTNYFLDNLLDLGVY